MPHPRATLASLVDTFETNRSDIAIAAPRGLRTRKVTYQELASLTRRFAAELVRREIRQGERVILLGENGPEWVAAFFGCVLRGVLPVPLDYASSPEFVQRVAREVRPLLLLGNAPGLTVPCIPFDKFDDSITERMAGVVDDLKDSDALQIVFTSGTTGDPKGVVHTHRNVLASLQPIETELGKYLKYERIFHPLRFLHTLPLSHVFGQFMGLWIPPLLAAEVHYESRLVAKDLIDRIRRERISLLAAVPRVLDLLRQRLLDEIPGLDKRMANAGKLTAFGKWRRFLDVHRRFGFKFWAIVCGGASLPPESERFWNSLGFVVVQGYGMTETTALVSLNHPFRAAQGTIGQVLPGREVKLSDEGEVLVRGETISNTIWQGGELRALPSEWLATGDLAEFDAQGNLRFRGRKKDVIVTASGLNIHPEDLESELMRQPGVRAASVIEKHSASGPEPFAVLLLSPGVEAGAVVQETNQRLADFQRIRQFIVWPEADLPRTSTGKVLKREIERRIGEGLVCASTSTGDLNLDSLGRVELQAKLEQQYGVTIDENALQQLKSADDIQALMSVKPDAATARHIYPKWPWSGIMRAVRGLFLQCVAMPLVRFLTKTAVRSNVSQYPAQPMLIVCNHLTSYDVPFIFYALPRRLRNRTAVAMSGEMMMDLRRARGQGNWFLNLLAPAAYLLITGLFNVFPLPQLAGFRQSFRHAGEAVDRGFSVLVFPEGRRSSDGKPQPFKSGAGLLWKELGTAALAVRIEGLGELKAQGGRWFRSGKITVAVQELLPAMPEKTPEELTKVLERAVFSSEASQRTALHSAQL